MLAEFELFPPPFLALIEAVSTGGLARTLVLNISPITSTDISVQPGNPRTLGTYAKARPDRNVEVLLICQHMFSSIILSYHLHNSTFWV